jgi:hypothetical protein
MLMPLLGRAAPGLPERVLFTDLEMKVSDTNAKKDD